MSTPAPLPNVDYIDHKPFWEATRQGRLAIQRCSACAAMRFPPRPSCRKCGSFDHAWVDVAPQGTLYSWTVTHVPMHPHFASAVPYALGVVALGGAAGVRMLGRVLAEPAALRMEMRLRAVFEPTADERVVLVNWQPDPPVR